MKTLRRLHPIVLQLCITLVFALFCATAFGQPQSIAGNGESRGPGKPVTVPVTIRVKEETELQNIDLSIHEDGEPQTIISLRGIGTSTPITLAVLIQEDLVPSVGNEQDRAPAEWLTFKPLQRFNNLDIRVIRTRTRKT